MSITAHLPRTALLDKLWARMNERGDFPLLSESLRATMAAMKNDDLDFTALVSVVLSDFALTQKVLRLANSAMYMAFGGNITTVTRALMVLGMDTVGHLVVGLKLVDHFHQSTPRRIDAKLELNRALLSGCVARKLTEHAELRGGEEAVVCTLMRQVGKLLVVCYLDSEWDRIRRRAAELNGDEAAACVDVLGVGFDEIGLEAAASWRLPDVIRAGMADGDGGSAHAAGLDEDDIDEDRQRPRDACADDSPERVRWLRAVSRCSTDVAGALAMPAGPQRDAHIAALAQHYAQELDIDADALVEIADRLAREEASDTVMREIVELRANADAIARAQPDPEACLEAGLADLRALPSEHVLTPVLALASESLLAGLAFTRTVMFVRREDGAFAARLGFGQDVDAALDRLCFDERFEPDVFHLAITNSVGIFIEQAQDPKMVKRLPAWYLNALPGTRAFVLLPVRVGTKTVGLLYGDWAGAQPARKITQQEMSVLNELARELGRFFPA
ncbi:MULTISPECIES: HDOD domain-containing protein [Burkholderia]|uniref:Histidine kinase n=1 Tax=Burkholderia diffusa TaxID=488732 RepID=A0A6P2HNJ3_9BURK|nr:MULTISPECIES: HDOD domain-containing protein [Burkholderia]KAB0657025.1 HDOD domain-containing protein [Burkholderia diffusa]MBM2652386.1 HDOD domain-containing protein [Burkholderia diffusa]RQR82446.1 HDOD domain-containing protein [Burkholderia sp. Bp9012]RQZ67743.1 HDOD domain-containing protein [Burkholderia sp. Bp9004]VWB19451.1 histidine kinase [Burkholderia diffusa]